MARAICKGVFAGLCWMMALAIQAQPVVLASIKPLQLVAAAVTDGVSEVDVLIRANADPHHYALRPSERRALSRADVRLWVGPQLEGFLTGIMEEEPAPTITALDLPGLLVRNVPAGGIDPHVWLDAGNAWSIARALAEKLSEIDAANAGAYRGNLAKFGEMLTRLDEHISRSLTAVPSPRAYAVYHDAYRYFEKRYNLEHVVSFTADEEIKPGIRRLLVIKREVQAVRPGCILLEPGVNAGELDAVIEDADMRFITLDVLGTAYPADGTGYLAFLQGVAETVLACITAVP